MNGTYQLVSILSPHLLATLCKLGDPAIINIVWKWPMYFVSLYVTRLYGLLEHFSDYLLSCVDGPREVRSHRGLTPIKLWNDEKYSNPHYNSLLPMSVHARETRYTHTKGFVSYLQSGGDMQFTLYTYTVSDVQTSLYNIHY